MDQDLDWARERINILGVEVTPATSSMVVDAIRGLSGQKHLILAHNLHSVYLYHSIPKFQRLYDSANAIVVDGRPVLAILDFERRRRGRRKHGGRYRIGSTDWLELMLAQRAPGMRVFILGGSKAVNETVQMAFNDAGAISAGSDGYFHADDETVIVDAIRDFRPQLVLVGMGMPIQEDFLDRNWASLPDATYAAVGGALDFTAGVKPLAPRWVGRIGLEWAWRLSNEPRRLSHRYLVEPIILIRVLMQIRRAERRAARGQNE